MLKDGGHILNLIFVLVVVYASAAYGAIASNWTNPDAQLPAFSSTYLVGERILLSWLALNQSRNDLWLTRYKPSTDSFALRIASGLDISYAGSFAWIIAVENEQVLSDTRFEFQFVPAGANYNASAPTELASPGFNLMLVNQGTLPNGTVAATTAIASETDASPTSLPTSASLSSRPPVASSPPPDDDPGLDDAAIAGIAIGVFIAVGLAGFATGYFVFKRWQVRHTKEAYANSEATSNGPYEILGDRRHPVEALGKEAEVHELNVSETTLVAEAASTPVHEVCNTLKKPGLHEMPG